VLAAIVVGDALWMGLPLVTCRGGSFASRVAWSVVRVAGLPELATDSIEGYAALALRIATDPAFHASLKGKLHQARSTCPLFDADRFKCYLETALVSAWQRWQDGAKPQTFRVEASPFC